MRKKASLRGTAPGRGLGRTLQLDQL